MTALFCALLLLGTTQISVVYSAGYVSDACIDLCSIEGNRREAILPADATGGLFGTLRELTLAYDTGLAAKAKYGEEINCWDGFPTYYS